MSLVAFFILMGWLGFLVRANLDAQKAIVFGMSAFFGALGHVVPSLLVQGNGGDPK